MNAPYSVPKVSFVPHPLFLRALRAGARFVIFIFYLGFLLKIVQTQKKITKEKNFRPKKQKKNQATYIHRFIDQSSTTNRARARETVSFTGYSLSLCKCIIA